MRWSYVDCSMAGMEPQRWRAAIVWIGLFDRRALGVEPVEAIVGDVSTTPALAIC